MKHNIKQYIIFVAVVFIATYAILGCKKQPAAQETKPAMVTLAADTNDVKPDGNAPSSAVKPGEPAKPAPPKPSLNDIIRIATSWEPTLTNWYGKAAPDFSVADFNGQKLTLSNYKGKTVMITFWATWCGPCINEIPHIVELRKQFSEDKLMIIGVSCIDQRNTPERIKKFVEATPTINYAIAPVNLETIPQPYNLMTGIPCSFFITPEGKIKLITEGAIPFQQMKAIIEADH